MQIITKGGYPTTRKIVKTVTTYKEGHYIIIIRSVHQKDIIIRNIYIPNIALPKCIKQAWTKSK